MNARNPLAAGALALALTTPIPAAAQSACIDYEPLRQVLLERGIRVEGTGEVDLGTSRGAVQLWVSPNGEWVVLGINGAGIACIIVAGDGWVTPERL